MDSFFSSFVKHVSFNVHPKGLGTHSSSLNVSECQLWISTHRSQSVQRQESAVRSGKETPSTPCRPRHVGSAASQEPLLPRSDQQARDAGGPPRELTAVRWPVCSGSMEGDARHGSTSTQCEPAGSGERSLSPPPPPSARLAGLKPTRREFPQGEGQGLQQSSLMVA